MLRLIVHAVLRMLATIWRGLEKTVGALLGGGGPGLPSPAFEELVDDAAEELRQGLDASPEAPAPMTTLGVRIHAYAAADASGRAGLDLDGMPDDVALTLFTLTDGQLARLAAAGPAVCGRWAAGEKTGIVGVPACRITPLAPPDEDAVPEEPDGSRPAPARLSA